MSDPSGHEPRSSEAYSVGVAVQEHNPAEEKYKNMLHLVAYDIRNPSRLRRIAKVCQDYGIRVEYSVFECDISEDRFCQLWTELNREIDREEDTVLAYRICRSCVRRIESMGRVVRPAKTLLYFL